MGNSLPKRKIHRLSHDMYHLTNQAFSITICTADRRELFLPSPFTDEVFDTIINQLAKKSRLYAATLLPNHVHFLFSPQVFDVIKLVGSWKSYVTKLARKYRLKPYIW
ncbi:MAG TPA: hypothetical protein ENN88_02025, partial [Candidatus Coatesbacteria bacterium]|nr:hypothetical protein [Candidatus Coatesbacteria bacterium]